MWLLKHGHGPTGFDKVEHLFKDECLLGLYDLNSVNLSSATFITFAKTMINIRQRNPEIVRVSNDGAQSQPLKLAAEKKRRGRWQQQWWKRCPSSKSNSDYK
ncbi:OLC1v1018601C1 [Oldenlandia corymbosa var. corymbosa]|uniref:OLC1v1018601C1 n=1 Tax=Oldenlandia corymbosa var. corymbosa TaxID=529605 RepID=A0AAV1EC08_OLDCO|nr:OLC1v1018601C1 [Oldenlandia corymbosa var. corymbosa]